MNFKNTGDKLILFFTLITIAVFLMVKQGNSVNPLLFLSQLFSLVGTVLFSLSFVLSSRTRFIEKLFDGLSDTYKTHHFIGALGFILLLNHPFFLILKAFFNESPIRLYFIPVGSHSYNYGIFSLYFLIALIVFTLFINFKYNTWKFTHTFMGLSLFFAMLHTLNIESDISRNIILGLWIKSLLILGCIAYIYKLFFYKKLSGSYTYKLVKLETVGRIHNIVVTPKGKSMKFQAGQYAFIRIIDNKNISTEEHPFSMVEKLANKDIVFSIKKSGDYTDKLDKLTEENTFEVIGPFGLIHTKLNKDCDYVFIAGGIGITPFVEAVKKVLNQGKNAYMFYSVHNQSEALYDNEFKVLENKFSNMYYSLWTSNTQGRLHVSRVQSIVGDLTNKFFFVCGPKSMMNDFDKQLKQKGVKSKNIYMEDFDLR
jgi:predicted ferric reductase